MIRTKFTAPQFSAHWSAMAGINAGGKDLPNWATNLIVETWDDDPEGIQLVAVTPFLTAWTYIGPSTRSWPEGAPSAQYVLRDEQGALKTFAAKVARSIHDVSFSVEKIDVVDPTNQLSTVDWWAVTAMSDSSQVTVRAIRYDTTINWRRAVELAELLDGADDPAAMVPVARYPHATLKAVAKVKAPSATLSVTAPGKPAHVVWHGGEGGDGVLARGVAYSESVKVPASLDAQAMDLVRDVEKFLGQLHPVVKSADDFDGQEDPVVEDPELNLTPDEDLNESFGDDLTPEA